MLIVLSPAKTLDYESAVSTPPQTTPEFIDDSAMLVDVLRKKSAKQLGKMMGISEKLAELNHQRFQDWDESLPAEATRAAALAFKGDVYQGLAADKLTGRQLAYAQEHLRILSGLYGSLRPLDAMLPYRLEMGSSLKNERGKDLYAFWGTKLTDSINEQLAATKSNECTLNGHWPLYWTACNCCASSASPQPKSAIVIVLVVFMACFLILLII